MNTARSSERHEMAKPIMWISYGLFVLATVVFWVVALMIKGYVHDLINDKPWPLPIQTFLRQPIWILLPPLIWLPVLLQISRSESFSLSKSVLLLILMLASLVIVGGIVLVCGVSICRILVHC
ncbi:MAG: hypothetical protein WCV00_20095 [Verrucomicrobiia bacterium]|jgi:hypothetical protein